MCDTECSRIKVVRQPVDALRIEKDGEGGNIGVDIFVQF